MVTRRGLLGAGGAALATHHRTSLRTVAFIYATDDAVSAPAATLAAQALEDALSQAGFKQVRNAEANKTTVLISVMHGKGAPESFSIRRKGMQITVAGADARGLTYALRELVLRVSETPKTALDLSQPFDGQPINPVRSVMRQFTCETYDKPWFYDREMWPAYLAMLSGNRFNRLHLAFGLGYDQLGHVRDPYFLFTYPYLLEVPGYDVRVTGLSDVERARNLATLKFISEETVRHGLDFQLGLWMHGYEWPAVEGVATITGLTAENHAAYCRDAMTLLLKTLPAVSSVALRIHGESGVKEGSYGFWKDIFAGVASAGRPIEIDLHAKGVDEPMIANALATGMTVNISPKYWGEHLGMPYHQAAIRDNEMPKDGQVGQGLMTLSEGARSFTRYGYADLLREDRQYSVRHRVFAGTQRLLASGHGRAYGDYGRMFGFCSSTGADVMEPLTYRGRRGTASATPRDGYAVKTLESRWDWQKYAGWYRSFGLGLYGETTGGEDALAAASRILPLITTAYAPSAACDAYWPEVYWNQPLAAEPSPNPYGDNIGDKVFDNATPFDPQVFSSMREHAAELIGEPGARVSPIVVATWLESLSQQADANTITGKTIDAERLRIDVAMLSGLGRFFAAKFRAGVLFALYRQTGDGRALNACIARYEQARTHWAELARAGAVYGDLSSSDMLSEHGTWADKLPLIDGDIAALKSLTFVAGSDARVAGAVAAAEATVTPQAAQLSHTPPKRFAPGEALALRFEGAAGAATLWYRHVNQAERWQSVAMAQDGGAWSGVIPAGYTQSPYLLQYYVEADARLYPGLSRDAASQPYFVVSSRSF